MTMNLTKLASITLIAVSATGTARAQITNGSFDTDLIGWTAVGDVSAFLGGAFLTTASATNEDDAPAAAGAFNESGLDAIVASNGLDVFAGLPVDSLDPDPGSFIYAFEGSGLTQTFNVTAGDVLSFDWKLFTNDPGADFAFVAINGIRTNLAESSLANSVSSPFAFESAGSVFSQSFATAQSVTFTFGVADVNDFSGTTALLVDNVQVVPEPSALSLGLAAASALFARRRARKMSA